MSDLIELRPEGLYCAAGDFYIDPWRPVPRAVITHGHADHARSGSDRYYAARASMGLLEWRLPGANLSPLDYGESLRLGDCRVSLHPAGHVLGSAQVRVECAGEVWVVSGDYKRAPDPTCALFDPQRCDVFITEATFAMPIYRWPTMAEVIAELDAFWAECQAQGETAVLLCYALGKAQRVLAELYARCPHRRDEVVLLHGAMETPVEIYRRAGIADKDIQTSGLNLNAQYDYVENNPPRLRGYQATNQVTVTVRDLARLGSAVDATCLLYTSPSPRD